MAVTFTLTARRRPGLRSAIPAWSERIRRQWLRGSPCF